MSKKPTPPCKVCSKPTERECAHVDCPNRRRLTANCPGSATTFPTYGRATPKRTSNGGLS